MILLGSREVLGPWGRKSCLRRLWMIPSSEWHLPSLRSCGMCEIKANSIGIRQERVTAVPLFFISRAQRSLNRSRFQLEAHGAKPPIASNLTLTRLLLERKPPLEQSLESRPATRRRRSCTKKALEAHETRAPSLRTGAYARHFGALITCRQPQSGAKSLEEWRLGGRREGDLLPVAEEQWLALQGHARVHHGAVAVTSKVLGKGRKQRETPDLSLKTPLPATFRGRSRCFPLDSESSGVGCAPRCPGCLWTSSSPAWSLGSSSRRSGTRSPWWPPATADSSSKTIMNSNTIVHILYNTYIYIIY